MNSTNSSNIADTARSYHATGLCVLPANLKAKRPVVVSCKAYQSRKPPTKENITHEQFLELYGLVLWLKELTAVPSMQLSPIPLRQCAERIGKIVLE